MAASSSAMPGFDPGIFTLLSYIQSWELLKDTMRLDGTLAVAKSVTGVFELCKVQVKGVLA